MKQSSMRIDNREYVDATKLSLNEWLDLFALEKRKKFAFIDYEFPTDLMRQQYLDSVQNRSEDKVIDLLRNFLIPSGSLGADESAFQWLMYNLEHNKEQFEKLMRSEHCKRLMKGIVNPKNPIWEGNTWVIDLLPHYPKVALDALNAYFLAHIQFLPDGRYEGLQDAMAIIRAKFIQKPKSTLLSSLDPYQFEHVIDALYSEMGYATTLTRRTYDEGRDIIAVKEKAAEKERVLIQCKKKKNNVGIEATRALLGVVSHEKANKGVLASATGFTPTAKRFQNENPILELLGNDDIQILLNTYFGPQWPKNIDYIISQSMKKSKEATSS